MDLAFMASNYDDRSSSYADNLSFSPKNVQNARLQSSLIWKVIICWIEIRSRQKRKLCMKCAFLYSNLLLLEYNPKLRLSRTGKLTLIPPTGGEPRGRDVSGNIFVKQRHPSSPMASPPIQDHFDQNNGHPQFNLLLIVCMNVSSLFMLFNLFQR